MGSLLTVEVVWFVLLLSTFGRAVFEAIEVKGCLRLSFEAATSYFFRYVEGEEKKVHWAKFLNRHSSKSM